MLFVGFLQWWYGPGWRKMSARLGIRVRNTFLLFSVPMLIKTLFAPWRRIITYPGTSMQARMRAGLDNLISRFVGLMVRLISLVTAFALITIYAIFGGLLLIAWPLLPLLGPALIVGGFL